MNLENVIYLHEFRERAPKDRARVLRVPEHGEALIRFHGIPQHRERKHCRVINRRRGSAKLTKSFFWDECAACDCIIKPLTDKWIWKDEDGSTKSNCIDCGAFLVAE